MAQLEMGDRIAENLRRRALKEPGFDPLREWLVIMDAD